MWQPPSVPPARGGARGGRKDPPMPSQAANGDIPPGFKLRRTLRGTVLKHERHEETKGTNFAAGNGTLS
jgi:hypothetical protein